MTKNKMLWIMVGIFISFVNAGANAGANAGGQGGHGGNVVVCPGKPNRLLDYVEMDWNPGIRKEYRLRSAFGSLEEKISFQIKELAEIDEEVASQIEKKISSIRSTAKEIDEDEYYPISSDTGALKIPSGCHIETAIFYASDANIQIRNKLISSLSLADQAGLWMHEGVYWLHRERSKTRTSEISRKIVAAVGGDFPYRQEILVSLLRQNLTEGGRRSGNVYYENAHFIVDYAKLENPRFIDVKLCSRYTRYPVMWKSASHWSNIPGEYRSTEKTKPDPEICDHGGDRMRAYDLPPLLEELRFSTATVPSLSIPIVIDIAYDAPFNLRRGSRVLFLSVAIPGPNEISETKQIGIYAYDRTYEISTAKIKKRRERENSEEHGTVLVKVYLLSVRGLWFAQGNAKAFQ